MDAAHVIFIKTDTLDCKKADSVKTYYIILWGTGFFSVSKAAFKNWQQPGENYFAFASELEPYFKTSNSKMEQEQKLKIKYGFLRTKENVYDKSNDEFGYKSDWSFKLRPKLSLNTSLSFESQFGRTFELDPNAERRMTSKFMSPSYTILLMGLKLKPLENIEMITGLSTFKLTTVKSMQLYEIAEEDILFGVTKGKKKLLEYGFMLGLEINREIFKNIDLKNSSGLFINKDHFKNMDIEIKTELSLKVNKHVKTVIAYHLIYDEDIINQLQERQEILVGYYF